MYSNSVISSSVYSKSINFQPIIPKCVIFSWNKGFLCLYNLYLEISTVITYYDKGDCTLYKMRYYDIVFVWRVSQRRHSILV